MSWITEEISESFAKKTADAAYWLEKSEREAARILEEWVLIDIEEENNNVGISQ